MDLEKELKRKERYSQTLQREELFSLTALAPFSYINIILKTKKSSCVQPRQDKGVEKAVAVQTRAFVPNLSTLFTQAAAREGEK